MCEILREEITTKRKQQGESRLAENQDAGENHVPANTRKYGARFDLLVKALTSGPVPIVVVRETNPVAARANGKSSSRA
jgi:hypothetical protein